MEALANLGIDWKLLIAQIVNFIVLLLVLKRFAYQPMLKLLDDRTTKIEKGLKDAEEAGVRLRAIESKEEKVLAEARLEAKRILVEIDAVAKKRDSLQLAETETRIKKLLSDAELKMNVDRTRMIEEAKRELADTVMLAVEKILKEKVHSTKDTVLIEKGR